MKIEMWYSPKFFALKHKVVKSTKPLKKKDVQRVSSNFQSYKKKTKAPEMPYGKTVIHFVTLVTIRKNQRKIEEGDVNISEDGYISLRIVR